MSTTLARAVSCALSLPEVNEQDHHGMASYRIRGKVIATVPDPDHLRVMLGPEQIEEAVAAYPDCCEPFYWGNRLACVAVTLDAADPAVVEDLLTDAWRRKAPKSLVKEYDATAG